MADIYRASGQLRELDEMTELDSVIHRLHPLVKLLVTVVYILVTMSFDKYDLSGLAVMVLYPVMVFQISGLSMGVCFHRLRFILPLVCFVGLFNPFFDRSVCLTVGTLTVTGGFVSMITLMLKGVFCLMASFLLSATTSIDMICLSLKKIHLPDMFVTLFLLTFRYVSVMMDELSVMTMAYQLRAPGQKGIDISAWGSFLGQLFLRSMDRASELYQSMRLRGFEGSFSHVQAPALRMWDLFYLVVMCLLFYVFRTVDIASVLGNLAMGVVR